MKKQILTALAAICLMFTVSNITASAAEPDKLPDVEVAVENVLEAAPDAQLEEADEISILSDPVIMVDASYSSKGVKIEWEPYEHKNLLGYIIIRLNNENGELIEDSSFIEEPVIVEADAVSYVDPTVEAGNCYVYGVTACIGKRDTITAISDPESELSITYVATLSKPTLSLSNTTDGIKLSWSKVENADGYQIYRKKYSSKTWDYLGDPITSGKTVSYVDTSASKGTSYNYMVAPLLETEMYGEYFYVEGTYSSSKYMKRLARPSVTVSNQSSYIKLSWKEIKGATSYNIYRDGEYLKSTTKLTWNDKDVKNGKKYTYQVRARYTSSSGNKYYSAKSATDTIYRLSRSSISSLKDEKKAKTFKVTYGKNTKATGYEIEYSRYSSFKNSLTKKVKSYKATSATIKTNYTKKTYYVRVRPYKTVSGKTYYGAWCTTKKVYVK